MKPPEVQSCPHLLLNTATNATPKPPLWRSQAVHLKRCPISNPSSPTKYNNNNKMANPWENVAPCASTKHLLKFHVCFFGVLPSSLVQRCWEVLLEDSFHLEMTEKKQEMDLHCYGFPRSQGEGGNWEF